MTIDPKQIPTKDLHAYMLGSVAPRPICFASTMSTDGTPNLSPFSFFNIFGSNPPIAIFSPARRVRDNTIKHTLENCISTGEVVISVVNYDMVQQMSLSSCEYPNGVNEFEKAGFTMKAADLVKPYLVAESPVNLECRVLEVKETGTEGGAGNLIICEIIRMHLHDNILDEDLSINPHKIDLVARMGKDFYCRASGSAVFEVPKPNLNLGIGMDQLPTVIKNSKILSGNDLGMLANVSAIPLVADLIQDNRTSEIINEHKEDSLALTEALHKYAKELLEANRVNEAWAVLLTTH